jgi:hypothetical protein
MPECINNLAILLTGAIRPLDGRFPAESYWNVPDDVNAKEMQKRREYKFALTGNAKQARFVQITEYP